MFGGRGAYLELSPRGGKWRRLKSRFGGKEKRISPGVYPEISLKEVRLRRAQARNSLGHQGPKRQPMHHKIVHESSKSHGIYTNDADIITLGALPGCMLPQCSCLREFFSMLPLPRGPWRIQAGVAVPRTTPKYGRTCEEAPTGGKGRFGWKGLRPRDLRPGHLHRACGLLIGPRHPRNERKNNDECRWRPRHLGFAGSIGGQDRGTL